MVFDYLAETGIIGLVSYLSMFVAVAVSVFVYRAKHREEFEKGYRTTLVHGVLFALPVAYLVQGLVLFDVLTIYVNLFLTLAFAVFMLHMERGAAPRASEKRYK